MIASRRSQMRRPIAVGTLIVASALVLAACGRKGTPEFDTGEPIVKGDTNGVVPGLNLPQKPASPQPPKKPKGTFILDPLL